MDNYSKGFRVTVGVLFAIGSFLFLTFFFRIQAFVTSGGGSRIWPVFLQSIPHLLPLKLFVSLMLGVLGYLLPRNYLNEIKSKRVGDNQHGSARWITEQEKRITYSYVAMEKERDPGVIVGRERGQWIIDLSEQTVCLVAPPGGGKTKSVIIPTFYYNARVNENTGGRGASILSVDVKKENFGAAANRLIQSGYKVRYLDFRNPLSSYHFNLMVGVNRERQMAGQCR